MIYVHTLEDKEVAANYFKKYNLLAMPVVDDEQRLVGIVTIDDAIDVLEEEATEDFEKMAAITPSDKPYFKTSVFETWKARTPWLLILMISATFTSIIITIFQDSLAAESVLIAFIPMIMGTGGNSANQSSVTIIRALSLGDVRFGDILRVFFKEFRVSFFIGTTLAISNFFKLIFFDQLSISVSLVICLTILLTVIIAKVIGCILPILSKKIGFDPAVMASPFITTIIDVLSLIIYFQVAKFILGI